MQARHILLYGALLATLAATWWASQLPDDEDETIVEPVVEPAARTARRADRPVQSVSTSAELAPTDLAVGTARLDAFASRDWTPPPPPPPPAAPPPQPTTPPLPYRYLGKWSSEDGLSVFLQQGNTPRTVKHGDVLDGVWRVEQLRPQAIVFTYLPLNSTVTLNIGESL